MNALRAAGDSDTEVCLNGGKCQDHLTNCTYFCLCTRGWKGAHCEEPDYNVVFMALCIVLIVLIITGTLVFLIWKTRRNSRQAQPILQLLHKQPKTKNTDEPTIAMTTEAISNDLYGHLLWDNPVSKSQTTGNDYSTLNATSCEKISGRSYERSIHYASLLWEKEPEPIPTKAVAKDADKLPILHKIKALGRQITDTS
uniref:EGF-like domain-containing protein n=1 Tax=Mesocestoides corti TaxID=53468 RepID=A0A5K3FNY3_MESCO